MPRSSILNFYVRAVLQSFLRYIAKLYQIPYALFLQLSTFGWIEGATSHFDVQTGIEDTNEEASDATPRAFPEIVR